MVEQQPIPEIEKRFIAAKEGIISVLKTRGGDLTSTLRQFGYEVIDVVRRDLGHDCSQALSLSIDGSWSMHNIDIVVWGYPLKEKSTFNDLVATYAVLTDPQAIELSDLACSEEDVDKSEEWSNKCDTYISQNKDRLAQSFVESLETTLANL